MFKRATENHSYCIQKKNKFCNFGFRVLKTNHILNIHCRDMLINFGVIQEFHKKVVILKIKVVEHCFLPKQIWCSNLDTFFSFVYFKFTQARKKSLYLEMQFLKFGSLTHGNRGENLKYYLSQIISQFSKLHCSDIPDN